MATRKSSGRNGGAKRRGPAVSRDEAAAARRGLEARIEQLERELELARGGRCPVCGGRTVPPADETEAL